MNGININTKDTVTVLNLLVVEEMCINAIGAKVRAVHFSMSKVSLFLSGD